MNGAAYVSIGSLSGTGVFVPLYASPTKSVPPAIRKPGPKPPPRAKKQKGQSSVKKKQFEFRTGIEIVNTGVNDTNLDALTKVAYDCC